MLLTSAIFNCSAGTCVKTQLIRLCVNKLLYLVQ